MMPANDFSKGPGHIQQIITDPEAFSSESDVEQKFIYPLLVGILGFHPEEIKTKAYLAPTTIDKGSGRKLGYYPDYVIYLSGIPSLVIEAKEKNGSVDAGLREALLYAHDRGAARAEAGVCHAALHRIALCHREPLRAQHEFGSACSAAQCVLSGQSARETAGARAALGAAVRLAGTRRAHQAFPESLGQLQCTQRPGVPPTGHGAARKCAGLRRCARALPHRREEPHPSVLGAGGAADAGLATTS